MSSSCPNTKVDPNDPFYGYKPLATYFVRTVRELFPIPHASQPTEEELEALHALRTAGSTSRDKDFFLPPSLTQWMAYILYRTTLSNPVLFYAVHLLRRLSFDYSPLSCSSLLSLDNMQPQVPFDPLHSPHLFHHRLLISSLIISTKYLTDNPYSNKSFSVAAGKVWSVKDVSEMELAMMETLDWRVRLEGEDEEKTSWEEEMRWREERAKERWQREKELARNKAADKKESIGTREEAKVMSKRVVENWERCHRMQLAAKKRTIEDLDVECKTEDPALIPSSQYTQNASKHVALTVTNCSDSDRPCVVPTLSSSSGHNRAPGHRRNNAQDGTLLPIWRISSGFPARKPMSNSSSSDSSPRLPMRPSSAASGSSNSDDLDSATLTANQVQTFDEILSSFAKSFPFTESGSGSSPKLPGTLPSKTESSQAFYHPSTAMAMALENVSQNVSSQSSKEPLSLTVPQPPVFSEMSESQLRPEPPKLRPRQSQFMPVCVRDPEQLPFPSATEDAVEIPDHHRPLRQHSRRRQRSQIPSDWSGVANDYPSLSQDTGTQSQFLSRPSSRSHSRVPSQSHSHFEPLPVSEDRSRSRLTVEVPVGLPGHRPVASTSSINSATSAYSGSSFSSESSHSHTHYDNSSQIHSRKGSSASLSSNTHSSLTAEEMEDEICSGSHYQTYSMLEPPYWEQPQPQPRTQRALTSLTGSQSQEKRNSGGFWDFVTRLRPGSGASGTTVGNQSERAH